MRLDVQIHCVVMGLFTGLQRSQEQTTEQKRGFTRFIHLTVGALLLFSSIDQTSLEISIKRLPFYRFNRIPEPSSLARTMNQIRKEG